MKTENGGPSYSLSHIGLNPNGFKSSVYKSSKNFHGCKGKKTTTACGNVTTRIYLPQ